MKQALKNIEDNEKGNIQTNEDESIRKDRKERSLRLASTKESKKEFDKRAYHNDPSLFYKTAVGNYLGD